MVNVINEIKLQRKIASSLTDLIKSVKMDASKVTNSPIDILDTYWKLYNNGDVSGYDKVVPQIVEYARYVLDLVAHYHANNYTIDPSYKQQILFQLDNMTVFSNEKGTWSDAKDQEHMFYYLKYENWLSKLDSYDMLYLRDFKVNDPRALSFYITVLGVERTRNFIYTLTVIRKAIKYSLEK